MRVLLLSQYFHPEVTAASFRLRPLAAGLVSAGHEVEVVCQCPSHPRGVVHDGFSARGLATSEIDGALVRHLPVFVSPSKRAPARLASYATYAAAATAFGATRRRPDVILASSPPLSVGAVGALLARRFRVPWVFDVRDLWPQVAQTLGEVPHRRALLAAMRLERRLYREAAAITTPTVPFADHIARFTEREKIELIPNGTTAEWLRHGEQEPDPAGAEISRLRFTWTYAGNVGLSQGLEVALEAAELLGSDFELLILGDGARRAALERRAASLPDAGVRFRDSVPVDEAARVMRASDALLVSLAQDAVLGQTIPAKLYDSCAIGRPVVVAAPGESHRLAVEEGAGLAVPPGDPGALAEAIRKLASDEQLRASVADRCRAFAARNLREAQVPRLERVLAAVAGGSAPGRGAQDRVLAAR